MFVSIKHIASFADIISVDHSKEASKHLAKAKNNVHPVDSYNFTLILL